MTISLQDCQVRAFLDNFFVLWGRIIILTRVSFWYVNIISPKNAILALKVWIQWNIGNYCKICSLSYLWLNLMIISDGERGCGGRDFVRGLRVVLRETWNAPSYWDGNLRTSLSVSGDSINRGCPSKMGICVNMCFTSFKSLKMSWKHLLQSLNLGIYSAMFLNFQHKSPFLRTHCVLY